MNIRRAYKKSSKIEKNQVTKIPSDQKTKLQKILKEDLGKDI